MKINKTDLRGGGRVPASCPPGFQGRYTVRSGDTMFFIAQRFGVSLQALINANPQISNPSMIFPGDVLCVPGAASGGGRVPASCPPGFQGRYTVQSGDTMFFIAQRFGVSLQALINANPHISNPNMIFPGDVLCVPGAANGGGRVPASCPPGFQCRYTVQPGDTMFLIAQRFGVSLQALINANPQISNPNQIFPGDVLCVPCDQEIREPVCCPPGFQQRYTVQPGDTMFLIAQRFGTSENQLIAANPQITDPNVLVPGDVLCVPGVAVPCSLILKNRSQTLSNASAVALLRVLNTGITVVDIMAVNLPEPGTLDDFDGYIVKVTIPGVGTFSGGLVMTDILDTWVTSIPLPEGTTLTTDTSISIRPFNEETGAEGSVLLSQTLAFCLCACSNNNA